MTRGRCRSHYVIVTGYEIEATPGGPRTLAMVLTVLRQAGATIDEEDPIERRNWDQGVGESVRVGFEIASDVTLVHDGVETLRTRFPGLGVHIREKGPTPRGRHEGPDAS